MRSGYQLGVVQIGRTVWPKLRPWILKINILFRRYAFICMISVGRPRPMKVETPLLEKEMGNDNLA
jgi:hypothetical protein